MDIDSLRIFRAVAQEQSVSRAARTLNCVPSNVTARIRALEGELNVKLFFRKPRGMALTPSGTKLLDYARRAVALMSEAKAAVAAETGPTGPFCIGSTESVAANRLPGMLMDYAKAFPQVELSLLVANSGELLDKLLDNEIEGAFVSKPVNDPRLEYFEVFTEELFLVSSLQVENLTPDVCASVVMQRPGCAFREALERWLAREGRVVRRKLELPSPEVALACVSAGMGIAVLPLSTLNGLDATDKVQLHKLPEDLRCATVSFVRLRNFPPTPAFEAFRQLCLGK
jgi:LysR family transcriptional regulator, cell division regulator